MNNPRLQFATPEGKRQCLPASPDEFVLHLTPPSHYNPPVRAAAVLHPDAGGRQLEAFRDPRAELVRSSSLHPGDLPEVAMVFGGDGSVHLVLAALAQSSVPLLVVPAGSGNDFAHAIGIRSRADALRAWRRFLDRGDNCRDIDLGCIKPMGADAGAAEEQYYCCIAGVGMDAEANEIANRMPAWMRANGGYIVSALRALAAHRPKLVSVTARLPEGRELRIRDRVLLVACGISPEYGNGMRLLPRALLDDGLLDLCFVHSVPKLKVLRFFHTVFRGRHLVVPEVQYEQVQSLRLEAEEPMSIYGDGEFLCRTPVDICLLRRALRVIVP